MKRLACLLLLATAACSHGTSHAVSTPSPVTPSPATTLSAVDIADAGLPSTIGPGPLTKTQAQQLIQYFEDHVSQAYATGDADALYRYLAGPMLAGNRATVALLTARGQRNVFRINVGAVTLDTSDKTRLIADASPDETLNYYLDSSTRKVLNNGLPGPSHLTMTVFLDYNPSNHTWYWTGQQDQSKANSAQPQPIQ